MSGGVSSDRAVPRSFKHAEPRFLGGACAKAGDGVVGGAAVGDDDLIRSAAAAEKRVEKRVDAPRFVSDGDDDRDGERLGSHGARSGREAYQPPGRVSETA